MHHVDLWIGSRNFDTPTDECTVPFVTLGTTQQKLLRVHPQIEGKGYGLTITDLNGKVLLTIDAETGEVHQHLYEKS